MARLLRPVMNTMCVIPEATASSTAYWMSGLSTMGSISLGLALVAGRKRVPSPATGNTALLMRFTLLYLESKSFVIGEQLQQALLVEHRDIELPGFVVLAPRVGSHHYVIR